MASLLNIINYAKKARSGYSNPEELMAETSFGVIEGFFITGLIITGLLMVGLLFTGFYFDITFLKIIGFLFSALFFGIIMLYRFIKKVIKKATNTISQKVRHNFNPKNTIDISATDVQ